MPPMPTTTQAYTLSVTAQKAPLSVLSWKGSEAMSEPYRLEVMLTSVVAGIDPATVLGWPARFSIQPPDLARQAAVALIGDDALALVPAPPARVFHGLITAFDELSGSVDETLYRMVLEPRLTDLSRVTTSRLFQNESVPGIIEAVLRQAGFEGADFAFRLRASYPHREYVTQYEETSLTFIQRMAADVGMWFRFEQGRDREVMVFGDDLDAYARDGVVGARRATAGLESAGIEAIQSLSTHRLRVPQSVRVNDYNHRTAGSSLLTEANRARGDGTTQGREDRWGEHHADGAEGDVVASWRHEAHLASQLTFAGTGNVVGVTPGTVLGLVDGNPSDAPHGLLITRVTHRAARDMAYGNSFAAMPSDRVYRGAPRPWPRIAGILPARVDAPDDDPYAYLTPEGWYRIRLPFDLDNYSPGGRSRPVRLARPYSGDAYGHHFPLIEGAEVALAFTDGDPDRPVIIGALHDSDHQDLVTSDNHTRNRLRTAGGNELRMEDKDRRQHVHLTTPVQTSELNLGDLVDRAGKERGLGAEMRTDGHAVVRGAKGVLISAEGQPGAAGAHLAMGGAVERLEHALERMDSLNKASQVAQSLVLEVEKQRRLLTEGLAQLKSAGILVDAPHGVAMAAGDHMQMTAERSMFITAGDQLEVGAFGSVHLAAQKNLALFAQEQGIAVTAAKGPLAIQARTGEMSLAALADIKLTSTEGGLIFASRGPITLNNDGSYIKLDGGNIEIGCKGDVLIKSSTFHWQGAASMTMPLPLLPVGTCEGCLLDSKRAAEPSTEL